ncbi:hypothetical protein [Microaceticoccus formicicus]|uniref:hypothetical protein n=1 Tax=Microaceticoccus formicicus TaxID=3118105 RepID=UPI003CD04D41|nr:HK97 gp10 family phage protein [Peptoniphilaceae bacterium AMB_02]
MTKEISQELATILLDYSQETRQGVEKIAQEVAQKGARTLQQTSPRVKGIYASGWTMQKQGDSFVIANITSPFLTHLLEKGHTTRNGKSRTKAKPHIGKVEAEVNKEFEEKVRRELGK